MTLTTEKGFVGLDERAKLSHSLGSSRYMTNFRVTPDGSLIKRKGTKFICGFGKLINGAEHFTNVDGFWVGLLNGKETAVISADGRLARVYTKEAPEAEDSFKTVASIEMGKCLMFEFGGFLYIKTESFYGRFDGETLTEVEGYIPCIATGCAPSGGGTLFEQLNLITDKRRQQFSADGVSLEYILAEGGITEVNSVTIDGGETDISYTLVDEMKVVFTTPPPEGINNVEITYTKPFAESDRMRIFGCGRAMLFGGNSDGRIFLWGNPEYPNYRFHSEMANGVPSVEYFPVNAFTVIGSTAITCIVQQYDRQLIFTKNEAFYSKCELKEDSLGNVYSSFPVFSLNGKKGCLFETDGCVINNKPVTLCDDGLNLWESTSVENEKNAVCFSDSISDSMASVLSHDASSLYFVNYASKQEFYFITGHMAYIYNYGIGRWYMFDGFHGNCYQAYGEALYFCNEGNLYAFSDSDGDGDENVIAEWDSSIFTNGKTYGQCDLVRFDSDIYVKGPISLRLVFENGRREKQERRFEFDEGIDRYLRISTRPSLRRAMPFGIKIRAEGDGEIAIHGITAKTREKERSMRHGIY